MTNKIILLSFLIYSLATMTYGQLRMTDKFSNNENQNNHLSVAHRLYPTQNMRTFLKLNTRNGQIWQVYFDVKGDNTFEEEINFKFLVTKDEEINDRFTLYSTQSLFNFILLDQLDGRMWQVHWSMKPEKRFIIPIK